MSHISYRLWLGSPHTHRLKVEMVLPAWPEPIELAIPAWTPGAYKIVDHARNIRLVRAASPTGNALAVERLDMHTWRIVDLRVGAKIEYEVFANKLMIHQAQLNADHAFLNGGPIWLCPKQARHLPARVEILAPGDWQVATALQPIAPGVWKAEDYDDLMDTPIEVGNFGRGVVEAAGVDWEIIWHDLLGDDPSGTPSLLDTVGAGFKKLAQAATALFGPTPFKRYVAFFHESQEPGYLNGLEHRCAMAMQGPLCPVAKPEPFFTMVAHEIVHAWNGRRLAPKGLGHGCDLWKPAHTTGLWIVEGVTEYYAALLCLRSGIYGRDYYLEYLSDLVNNYEKTPGRRVTTLEEASFITWNFGDDRWNGAVNYYLKGALVAWALDVEIRIKTRGTRSLDDVMRAMWAKFGDKIEYLPGDFEVLAAEVAGAPLVDFFDHHLRSVASTDWGKVAAGIGLVLGRDETLNFGIRAAGPAGAVKIEHVDAFGPAEEAGLQSGDVLVSIGKRRASESQLSKLGSGKPGSVVPLMVLRGDRLFSTDLIPCVGYHYSLSEASGAEVINGARAAGT